MAELRIDFQSVKQTQPTIKKPIQTVSSAENRVDSLRMQLDWEVRNRCQVDERLREASRRLTDAVSRLHKIDRFIINSIGEYERIEDSITAKAKELETGWYNPQEWEDAWKLARGLALSVGGALANPHDLLRKNGIQFFLEEKNGKSVIKVGKWSLNPSTLFFGQLDASQWQQVRKRLVEGLQTGRHTFSKRDIQTLMREGIALYDNEANRRFRQNYAKFAREAFPQLKETLDGFVGVSPSQRAGNAFRQAINPLNDFTGWMGKGVTHLDRVAKLPGIVGIGIDIWDNRNTIRNEDGKVDFFGASAEQQKKFIVDTSVDVMSGAAAMAAGAAVGSLIAPPLGTVVGAGAGGFVYALTSVKVFGDDPKKSVVDVTKDFANDAVDGLMDGFRKLDKIFW